MPGMGERAYAYAKASGIIGKSFVGKRSAALNNISRIPELDRLIFPDASKNLPEKELMKDLEIRIINRAVEAVGAVFGSFRTPPEFLVLLIRGWEYQDLKNILNAVAEDFQKKPVYTGLGPFAAINWAAWPDMNAMLAKTEYAFLLKMENKNGINLQTELDRHYYTALWKALLRLNRNDRKVSEKILAEEISLRNVVCALRLRTYYQLESDEVKTHLININTETSSRKKSLAADALSSLELPLDNRQAWAGWKREKFLNPQGSPGPVLPDITIRRNLEWRADPRYFQNAAANYLYRMARGSFRTRPSSLDTMFCFIRIKQYEEDVLTSCAEGLGMGLANKEVLSMIGVNA